MYLTYKEKNLGLRYAEWERTYIPSEAEKDRFRQYADKLSTQLINLASHSERQDQWEISLGEKAYLSHCGITDEEITNFLNYKGYPILIYNAVFNKISDGIPNLRKTRSDRDRILSSPLPDLRLTPMGQVNLQSTPIDSTDCSLQVLAALMGTLSTSINSDTSSMLDPKPLVTAFNLENQTILATVTVTPESTRKENTNVAKPF